MPHEDRAQGDASSMGFAVSLRTPSAYRFRSLWEPGERVADTSRMFGPYLDLLTDRDFSLLKDALAHERMFRDGQIRSCVRLRQFTTASRKLEFLPREDSFAGKAAAEFTVKQWARVRRPTEVLLNVLDAIPRGCSFQEISWVPDPQNLCWYSENITPVHKDRFRFSLQGELAILSPSDPFYGEIVPPRLFMHHVYDPDPPSFNDPEAEGQLWYGRGEFDRIYPWFLWKQLVMRLGFAYLDHLAYPIKIGRYPYRQGETRLETTEFLKDLSHHRVAAWPSNEGWDIDFLQTSASGHNVGMDYLAYIDTQIAKVLLGSTLLQEPGERGSYSLGTSHIQSIFGSINEADSLSLCDTVENTWVKWLFELNGMPAELAPRVTQSAGKTSDINQIVDVLLLLADRGYPVSFEQIAEMTGVRPAREGETLLKVQMSPTGQGSVQMDHGEGSPFGQAQQPSQLPSAIPADRSRMSLHTLAKDRGICEKGASDDTKKPDPLVLKPLDVELVPEQSVALIDIQQHAVKFTRGMFRTTTRKTVQRKLGPIKEDRIRTAATAGRMISFDYANLAGESKRYTVEPYSYRYRRGFVYLYAYHPKDGTIKSFFAHKIHNIRQGRRFAPRWLVELTAA